MIEDLEKRHPGVRDRLLDAKGVRRYVNLYVGEEDIRFLDGLGTKLKRGSSDLHRAGHRGRLRCRRASSGKSSCPEIGEAGQRRLGEATAAVAGEGLAHEIASRYAEGAGFGAWCTARSTSTPLLRPPS